MALPVYPTTSQVAEQLGFGSSASCAKFLLEELKVLPYPFGAGRGRGHRWKWTEVEEAMDAFRAVKLGKAPKKPKVVQQDDGFFRQKYSDAKKQLTKSRGIQ